MAPAEDARHHVVFGGIVELGVKLGVWLECIVSSCNALGAWNCFLRVEGERHDDAIRGHMRGQCQRVEKRDLWLA